MATESFRVASFNVENLLHPGVHWAGRKDAPYKSEEYQQKVSWAAGLLKDAAVDLVGFQELFSEQSIGDVLARTELGHSYTPDLENGRNIATSSAGRKEAKGPFCGIVATRSMKPARSSIFRSGGRQGSARRRGRECAFSDCARGGVGGAA
jgi:hypothetical protein